MAREGLTAFQAVNQNFEEAASIIDLDAEMRSVLTTTYREISVQIPVRLDNGDLVVAQGYRCSTTAPGPLQGRHPLPPERRPRGGAGAGVADDLEDGACSTSPSAGPRAASPSTRRR